MIRGQTHGGCRNIDGSQRVASPLGEEGELRKGIEEEREEKRVEVDFRGGNQTRGGPGSEDMKTDQWKVVDASEQKGQESQRADERSGGREEKS